MIVQDADPEHDPVQYPQIIEPNIDQEILFSELLGDLINTTSTFDGWRDMLVW